MTTLSLTLPADGQTIDASDVNTPLNAIATVINGSIDSTNITDGGVTPNELTSGTGSTWAWTSYTPTAVGWTGTPTTGGRYIQMGKTVIWEFSVTGTSNATGATLTLPVTARNAGSVNFEAATLGLTDNSAGLTNGGRATIIPATSATILNLYKDPGGTVWTNTGTKAASGLIIYEAA